MKKLMFLSLYLVLLWVLSSCNSNQTVASKVAQDSIKVFYTKDGRLAKDTLDNEQWIYQKEYQVIKKMQMDYGVEMKIGGHKNVIYLEVTRIKEEGSWPEVVALIDQLTELKILRLKSEEINSLDFKQLKKLESLDVFYPNNLSGILVIPSLSPNLRSFSVEKSKITQVVFPGTNYSIKYLTIQDTKLQQLDQSIIKLTQLEHLSLRRNKLQQLPLGLQNLQNLKVVRLNNNQLKDFKFKFPKVTKLTLEGNPLKGTTSIKKAYPNADVVF